MQLLARLLRALAALLRRLPLKRRVAFLSRQSSKPSLDYQLLIKELRRTLSADEVVVCLTEPETKSRLRFALGTLKQLYYACTSKVIVVDGYVPAVSIPKKDERVTVIQMWHALGAIKKFGYQCLDTPAGRSSESARIARMHRNYDIVIAGGPGAVLPFSAGFGCPTEIVRPLGLPRIDYLRDDSPGSPRHAAMEAAAKRNPFLAEGRPIALYAPTLRKGEAYDSGWLSKYVRKLAARYDGTDTLLVVAPHPLNRELDPAVLAEHPCVRMAEGASTIDLLGFADTVITDYSAIAFEAGLLGKKLEFFVPDIVRYRISPGLNVQVDEIDEDFFADYFRGVEDGVTHRIAALVKGKLNA